MSAWRNYIYKLIICFTWVKVFIIKSTIMTKVWSYQYIVNLHTLVFINEIREMSEWFSKIILLWLLGYYFGCKLSSYITLSYFYPTSNFL
jgi:hypothetical protein